MNEIIKAIRVTVVLWVLVAVIYPAGILAIAQLPFLSNQANGSLIRNAQGQVVGSALIGQPFTSDKYFNSRPSTTNYSTADPKKDPSATRYSEISFDEAISRNLGIMDATAFALCRDQKLPIKVFSIIKNGALMRVVLGEDEGTLVYV